MRFFLHGEWFYLDIKVLRSQSNETSLWMTSGKISKLFEPNPLTSTTNFHQRPVRQAFLLVLFVCLSVRSNGIYIGQMQSWNSSTTNSNHFFWMTMLNLEDILPVLIRVWLIEWNMLRTELQVKIPQAGRAAQPAKSQGSKGYILILHHYTPLPLVRGA